MATYLFKWQQISTIHVSRTMNLNNPHQPTNPPPPVTPSPQFDQGPPFQVQVLAAAADESQQWRVADAGRSRDELVADAYSRVSWWFKWWSWLVNGCLLKLRIVDQRFCWCLLMFDWWLMLIDGWVDVWSDGWWMAKTGWCKGYGWLIGVVNGWWFKWMNCFVDGYSWLMVVVWLMVD